MTGKVNYFDTPLVQNWLDGAKISDLTYKHRCSRQTALRRLAAAGAIVGPDVRQNPNVGSRTVLSMLELGMHPRRVSYRLQVPAGLMLLWMAQAGKADLVANKGLSIRGGHRDIIRPDLVRRYKAGQTMQRIADTYRKPLSWVCVMLTEAGESPARFKGYEEMIVQELAIMRAEPFFEPRRSIKDVAEGLKISTSAAQRLVRRIKLNERVEVL